MDEITVILLSLWTTCASVTPPVRPGVAQGNRRGSCACRVCKSVRWRICDNAREGGDWRLVAEMNSVNATARNWINKTTPTLRAAGETGGRS